MKTGNNAVDDMNNTRTICMETVIRDLVQDTELVMETFDYVQKEKKLKEAGVEVHLKYPGVELRFDDDVAFLIHHLKK